MVFHLLVIDKRRFVVVIPLCSIFIGSPIFVVSSFLHFISTTYEYRIRASTYYVPWTIPTHTLANSIIALAILFISLFHYALPYTLYSVHNQLWFFYNNNNRLLCMHAYLTHQQKVSMLMWACKTSRSRLPAELPYTFNCDFWDANWCKQKNKKTIRFSIKIFLFEYLICLVSHDRSIQISFLTSYTQRVIIINCRDYH